MHTSKPRVALFDVDGVIIRGFSMLPFGRFMLRRGIIDREGWSGFYTDFEDIREERVPYAQFAENAVSHFALALKDRSREEVLAAGKECAASFRVFWYVRELLQELRQHGVRTIAVSGSPEECLLPLIGLVGLDEVHGMLMEVDSSGRYTGGVVRNLALKPVKAALARELAAQCRVVAAFGDSDQDSGMLETAQHPFAMNARPQLAAVAAERGWTTLDFRHNVPRRVMEELDAEG